MYLSLFLRVVTAIVPFPLLVLIVLVMCHFGAKANADPKRVFMAPDDHTDYFWSATDVEYRQFFLTMLDYYINQAELTKNEPSQHQSRFSADGSLWLWEYEKNKSPGEFQRLVDKIKSGHISAPKNPLVITYGGVPAEAVLRSMYYSGQLERRYGLNFPLAVAMENAGMSYGLGALWAGAGVQYSWKGVCNCPSLVPNLDNRDNEIYNWLGPDGSRILMKWNSLHRADDNQSIGGYAEARSPTAVLDLVTTNAGTNGFGARYPYNTIGVFGQGWDDLFTTNLNIQQSCKANSNSTRSCIVSNSTDFFQEFDSLYGATIPTISAGFGNEWDLSPASLAEVSARVKRSLEKLRSAEALATLVSLENPSFLNGREAERDRAFLNMGLYFEHDFENGGPRVPGSARIQWQRQVATQIENYVNTLMADATSVFGAMIQKNGTNPRFFVFNPLSWVRTDSADIPYSGALPAHVIDLSNGLEVPSQSVTIKGIRYLRIEASDIPSVGYKVFEIRPGSGQTFATTLTADASTGVMENETYRITVSPRGAITSLIDKRLGNREFAGAIGGFTLNDLGSGNGSRQIENSGPVSVTLVATGTSPLAHTTRVTLTDGSDRIEIQNEVNQNFSGTQRWRFSFNLTNPDVRHEEVGAIARARLTTDGGSYSPRNARYDYLTLNHFAAINGAGSVGVTLSNADAYFMQVGASGVTTLDSTTPQLSVVLGASLRPYNPILNQAGDSYFLQRFALRSHGAYNQVDSMRFALEHQNPLTVGSVSGGNAYPESSHSFLTISDPDVLLWALKPAEEGIGEGVIARVWNLTGAPKTFSLALDEPIASAKYVWHTETDRGNASVSGGALTSAISQNQLLTFRIFPSSLPPSVKIVASDARVVESGDTGSFTISRTGSTATPLNVGYSVSGTAAPGSDYQALPGTATIPAGASSVIVPITPISDTVLESDETVTVTLLSQANYLLSTWNSATASIIDAETTPSNTAVLFPFREGTGSTTTDIAGNNTGTLQNGTLWLTGKYGSGLNFDGVDDHVSVPDAPALDLGNTGTIEAWVKLDSLNRWHGVISKGTLNSNPAHNYALEIDNLNRFLCIIGDTIRSVELKSTISALAGQFYHLACTWNGTSLSLYVNASLNNSIAQAITPLSNSQPLYIGQFGNSADRLDGTIDEVRIYNRALSQVEIQQDMNTAIVEGAPSDTTPPTAPTNLGGTVISSNQINLSWTGSTDNVGVTGYQVERCQSSNCTNFISLATVTGVNYNDTGLNPATSYRYRVRATDAATNTSGYSNIANGTTPASQTLQGLVAAYAFQEGSGTSTADGSGNVNGGTLTNGPVWTTQGKYGNGLSFDGVNDYVSVADKAMLDLGATGTIEAWTKLNAINRWHSVIAKGNSNSDPAHNYALEITNANRVRCILGGGSSSRTLDSTITMTTNQFRHLACTWNGSTLSLYIDGNLNITTAQNLTPTANTAPLFIGQFGGNSDRLNGLIDEVRIYNRALTQAEIQFDMNTSIP